MSLQSVAYDTIRQSDQSELLVDRLEDILMAALWILLTIAGIVCHIIILIDAFRDEIWKGILGLFCWPYLLYYAFAEYEGDYKYLVLLIWLGGYVLGAGLRIMALGAVMPGVTH